MSLEAPMSQGLGDTAVTSNHVFTGQAWQAGSLRTVAPPGESRSLSKWYDLSSHKFSPIVS